LGPIGQLDPKLLSRPITSKTSTANHQNKPITKHSTNQIKIILNNNQNTQAINNPLKTTLQQQPFNTLDIHNNIPILASNHP